MLCPECEVVFSTKNRPTHPAVELVEGLPSERASLPAHSKNPRIYWYVGPTLGDHHTVSCQSASFQNNFYQPVALTLRKVLTAPQFPELHLLVRWSCHHDLVFHSYRPPPIRTELNLRVSGKDPPKRNSTDDLISLWERLIQNRFNLHIPLSCLFLGEMCSQ